MNYKVKKGSYMMAQEKKGYAVVISHFSGNMSIQGPYATLEIAKQVKQEYSNFTWSVGIFDLDKAEIVE